MASPMAQQALLMGRPTPRPASLKKHVQAMMSPRAEVKAALQDHAIAEIEHAEHVEAMKKAHALALERKDAKHAHERERARVLVLHAETQASIKARKEELAAKYAHSDLVAEHAQEVAKLRATLEREYERKEADCNAKLAAETAALENCTLELEEKNQEVQMLRAAAKAETEQHALELARQQVRDRLRQHQRVVHLLFS